MLTTWMRSRSTLLAVGLLGLVALGCGQNPVARPPEVSLSHDLLGEPIGAEPATPAQFQEEESVEPGARPGRQGPGQGPQGTAPDPQPLRSSLQYELDLRYARGQLEVLSAQEKRFSRPLVTPRRLGRFAIELWIGLELVERVRFDFPLLGAEEPRDASLEKGLVTRQRVLVPATDRPTRALIIDRATGQEIEMPWPPVEPEQAPESGSSESGSSE